MTEQKTHANHAIIRLIIVDDHPIVREGLKRFFAEDAQIRVVAEATNGQDAIELVTLLKPDVILMELKLPLFDGLAVTRQILAQQPEAKIVVFTLDIDPTQAIDLVNEGVLGYILKDVSPKRLIGVIKDAFAGYPQFDPQILNILLNHRKRRERINKAFGLLTLRERQILQKVVLGKSYREIGIALSVSESTVKFHISHILQKLQLTNRVQLAVYATQNFQFESEPPKSS